eukprot:SM000019S05050  [mRNA]  locus=s19:602714:604357:- [translate_table: standard]
MDVELLNNLTTFCEKASMGCVVAPMLSVGATLLREAAVAAAFHYGYVEIVECTSDLQCSASGGPLSQAEVPSPEAVWIADALAGLGRSFNGSSGAGPSARHAACGAELEEGVRVHSLRQPGLQRSTEVRLGAPGQSLTLRLDITDARAYMPGLLLAIRRVVRLKVTYNRAGWCVDATRPQYHDKELERKILKDEDQEATEADGNTLLLKPLTESAPKAADTSILAIAWLLEVAVNVQLVSGHSQPDRGREATSPTDMAWQCCGESLASQPLADVLVVTLGGAAEGDLVQTLTSAPILPTSLHKCRAGPVGLPSGGRASAGDIAKLSADWPTTQSDALSHTD